MQVFEAFFTVAAVFLIGAQSGNSESFAEIKTETKWCVKKCGRDLNVKCEGAQTSEETTICACVDETYIYDEGYKMCIERCMKKCGIDGDYKCSGDQKTDETTICGCANETEAYFELFKVCVECKCGEGAKCTWNGVRKKCTCREGYVDSGGTCKNRCIEKCGEGPHVKCEGDQTSYETTICGCRSKTQVYNERDKRCIDRCTSKCGSDTNIKCKGDQTMDETTICACAEETMIYNFGFCQERCMFKCGLDDPTIECTGDQTTHAKTICGCKEKDRVYNVESQKCIVPDPCLPNPCGNDSSCSKIGTGIKCTNLKLQQSEVNRIILLSLLVIAGTLGIVSVTIFFCVRARNIKKNHKLNRDLQYTARNQTPAGVA